MSLSTVRIYESKFDSLVLIWLVVAFVSNWLSRMMILSSATPPHVVSLSSPIQYWLLHFVTFFLASAVSEAIKHLYNMYLS